MKQFIKLLVLLPILAFGAKAPDFTVTDYKLKTHRLYADYLNKEKVVVLKFFFVDCPPCNSIAPTVQQSYLKWGEGKDRVEFIELSTQNWDQNNNVKNYALKHGLTFPGVGFDGGGFAATAAYKSGTFGQYYGTPTFAVIAPNGEVTFNINYTRTNQVNLDSAIAQALRVKSGSGGPDPDPEICDDSFGIQFISQIQPDQVFIRNLVDPIAPEFELENYKYNCEYAFPEFKDFYYIIPFKNSAPQFEYTGISSLDIILMQKHILGVSPLTSLQLAVADVNNSGTLSAADITELRKYILGINNQFKFVSSPYTWAINPYTKASNYVKSVRLLDMINGLKSNVFGMAQYGDVSGASQFKKDDEVLSRVSKEFVIRVKSYKKNNEYIHEIYTEFDNTPISGYQFGIAISHFNIYDLKVIENPPPGLDTHSFFIDKTRKGIRALWVHPNAVGSIFQSDKPLLSFKTSEDLILSSSNIPVSEVCYDDNSNPSCESIRFIFERPLKLKTIGELVVTQTGNTTNEFELISSESNILSLDIFNMDGIKISCRDIEGLNSKNVKFKMTDSGLFYALTKLESGEIKSLKVLNLR
ncbi:MAG: redoxin domain-containing protein [Saprospiraceae bacterium]|nr:redoxin domain-containing protein [Saprospiraceae bacterium]